MDVIRKLKTARRILRDQGFTGLRSALKSEFKRLREHGTTFQNSDNSALYTSIWESDLIYRYATCNDLIRLKAKYPQFCIGGLDSSISYSWSLKQMGTLLCAEKIIELAPKTVLEVGAGWNTFFDQHFGNELEYWMIDDGNWDPIDRFDEAIKERHSTHFVRSLLGSFCPDLPDAYFDMVISVSVLEHVPQEKKPEVYKDMFRVLKPGGYIVHSIDDVLPVNGALHEYECIEQAGFLLPPSPTLRLSVDQWGGQATLLEPLDIVYRGYLGLGREDIWTNLKSVARHFPTILVVGSKPKSINS